MKKVLFTAAAVFAFGFANAQETKFGVKAGLNLSNYGGDVEDTSIKIGFQVGGFAEIKISEKFAVQPELVFSTLGAKAEIDFFGEKIEASDNLSYVNVPIMAKYFVAEGFSLEVGPQVGFLLSAKTKLEAGGESETEDVKDAYQSIDFGLNFGAGYDVAENINLSVRYTTGLSNLLKDSEDYKINNSNIALAIGYKF